MSCHGRCAPELMKRTKVGRGRNIQHTVRYTELAPDRFKNFWRLVD